MLAIPTLQKLALSLLGTMIAALAVPQMLLAQGKPIAIADGIYFYGQSPRADQLGQDYLVLQVKKGRVKGVVYQLRSEYSCFTGQVAGNQLQLMVQDPYEKETSPYAIALLPPTPIAGSLPKKHVPNLAGYYVIPQLGSLEQKLLQACL